MFVLFEEAGKYLGGRVLSEAEASAQVELDTGKRVKVKGAHIVLRFEKPAPAELIADARALAAGMDLDLAWEFAPEGEFAFADLATEYFQANPSLVQQAAALFALFEAPHYFRRAGKGRFKKAPAEIIQQALAAIEKKKQVLAQIAEWAAQLVAGECPAPVREQLYKILFKPDKNAPEYKAVVEASRTAQRAPLDLLERAGAIDSAYQFHWKRFLFENFPKGTAFPPALSAPAIADDLPRADGVEAFSIDDSQTTEIDDALSVQGLGSGTVTVGVHIAAPGLAFAPGSPLDQVARARMSTVYMPGYKITMLPDAVVQSYTLLEGGDRPAVSLYARFDEATLELQGTETKIERVPIVANLRHDRLDGVITQAWLEDAAVQSADTPEVVNTLRAPLSFLFRLAKQLKAQREVVRGKPENFNRPDYNFRLVGNEGEPEGSEQVQISTRQRGAPLDLIVSEAMILANSGWGGWLGELGVPGLYRSQASLAPGIKVRMGTRALPHAGLGVKSYAWSTSPLRRYTDLVNQWQIIAAARHGKTAALAAPFKPKDADLFSILSGFDAAYATYNAYQGGMERFWTLKYLQQQGIGELTATVIKDIPNGALVRADTLPLVFPVAGQQERGAHVRVKLGEIDEIALDVHGTVIERLDAPADAAALDDSGTDEEEEVAGPIAIAVDLNDSEAAAENTPA
ncbi:ribonuclease catalytic domain-containing protein [Variovorax arabinosiphilus]|uniref:ribonuclease catalytic domain-containing protein n=1 Tax=Variovorax arabinosiphilus TaxID=3053498 RepID=UPI0025780516|nr:MULTISPECIES: RNB domain-containing ribonuclease [unclassified Variovorax]MDM0122467.1 RNB domain-containing ribonuclease [Variovorax sp. J2L1-78]MDM0131004.1 RNB domain-containing ribonuclease [Variovorax sp. J2L1-63]MDM0235230.1 RNB domain-containing ribonuclease [Variovorax sp. J2R1-6]